MNNCETCGLPFEPKHFGAGRYCSGKCYYARGPDGPRKASVTQPRYRTAKGHPLAPASGRVAVSRLVLYEKIGVGPHTCQWCGTMLTWTFGLKADALIVDHLDWDRLNDDPSNLVPSCISCNARRAAPGRRNAIQPGELTVPSFGGKHRTRAIKRTCDACGNEFLSSLYKEMRFCSRLCANRRGAYPGESTERERLSALCVTCGVEFFTIPSRPARYCCRTCWTNRARA